MFINNIFKRKKVLTKEEHNIPNISNSPLNKIFCIGRNKTGTTSLERVLLDFGYKMGNQPQGELLIKDYANRNWNPIIRFCDTADAFQDIPFSLPFTWLVLHKEFPNAKFILTIRDAEDWYRSLTTFHAKLFTNGIRIPVKEDLINAEYRYKGWIWEGNRSHYQTPEDDIYNKDILIEGYRRHNVNIRHYFKDNPNFLEINISETDSYIKLCNFLEKQPLYSVFPHLNKT